jgi:hypothetical protein
MVEADGLRTSLVAKQGMPRTDSVRTRIRNKAHHHQRRVSDAGQTWLLSGPEVVALAHRPGG